MNAARTSPSRIFGLRARLGAALVAVVLSVAGCDVRLETPPPTEPAPDALEVARRAAVTDALTVSDLASSALAELPEDDPVRGRLDAIVDASAVHVERLGGVYDPGLEGVPDEPTVDPTDDGAPADVQDVVDRLVQSFSRTRGTLENTPDGGLARLTASIAVSHLVSAESLARAADLDPPEVETSDEPVPDSVPEGVAVSVLLPVLRGEDEAGYAYEVLAARLADEQRAAALARAAVHRARGQAWAVALQVDGSAQDPRRVAYDLPEGLLADEPDLTGVQQIELTLADSYTTLVGRAAPAERAPYLDLATDAYRAALSWGAEQQVLPGMPEQES